MKATRTFWTTANESFSAKERSEYNKLKSDLYLASDSLLHAVAAGHEERAIRLASDLHMMICEIPSMEGES